MEIELKEIRDFIATIPPFDRLNDDVLEKITKKVSIRYIRHGSPMPPENITENRLYLLRTGAISLISKENTLLDKLSEGDICSALCLRDKLDKFNIQVDEDTLVYSIPCSLMDELVETNPNVVSFIQKSTSQRLSHKINAMQEESAVSSVLMHTPLSELLHSPVIQIESQSSIKEAAIKMTENSVSSLLIMQSAKVIGIITTKDISQRCVAAGLSTDLPVDQIMSNNLVSEISETNGFEALMLMTNKHIYHLPIIDDDELKGIISLSDLMRTEGQNSVYLANAIRRAGHIDELVEHSQVIPQLQTQLVKMGATPEHVGKGVTAVANAITKRLIKLAEEKLGPAPVTYAWLSAGSQARYEQTSYSDQDNALIISDELQEKDKPWFEALAKFVTDGLARCGYEYCPGGVMASNPKWRQTSTVWAEYFNKWVNTPSPKALMYCSIFFDLRTTYGDANLLDKIRAKMLNDSRNNSIFLANLSMNALKLRPPLGFFRGFVLIHDGKHNDTLDLKHNGLAPIVDLARIYALSEGIKAVQTKVRIQKAAGSRSLSHEGAENLLDAYEFIASLRIKHQATQIQSKQKPDNYMSPVAISKLEREHLKDAFNVIQTMQSSLESRFHLA